MLQYLATTLLALLLVACAQVQQISREQVAAHLNPILDLEKRVDQVKSFAQWLVQLRSIDDDKIAELKASHNVYFLYYLAASVDLASGNLKSYRANLERAERELEYMEATLKKSLTELGQTNPKSRFFESEL